MSAPKHESVTAEIRSIHSQGGGIRFSLRWLLVGIALCAVGVAALVNASTMWLRVTASLTLLAFAVVLLVAICSTGARRAFMLGFLAWGIIYLVVVGLILRDENNEINEWPPTILLTSQALQCLHTAVFRQVGTYPPGDLNAGLPIYGPDHDMFMKIGQLLWAWILAMCGGLVAKFLYRVYQRKESSSPG